MQFGNKAINSLFIISIVIIIIIVVIIINKIKKIAYLLWPYLYKTVLKYVVYFYFFIF